MPDDEGSPDRPPGLHTARLEAFSDGVFAIAITLLVLKISVPSGSEDDLLGALVDEWPSYLTYLVSFSTIGVIWVIHAAITECIGHADGALVRLNMLLLLFVAFLPFPTRLLAEHSGSDEAARVAATVYGVVLLTVSLLVTGLWRYAVHAELVHPDAGDNRVQMLTDRLTPSLAVYMGMIVTGLFLPVVAVVGYLVIALYLLVPFRLISPRG